jgi:GNAT superfamily N-acetyltransferase
MGIDADSRHARHELIRARARVHQVPPDAFRVRLAQDAEELRAAFTLLHEAYAERGLEPVGDRKMRITPHHVLQESLVFVAYEGDRPVGTITVTGDSPAGLPLDKDYPAELDRLRDADARLAEIGSLAVLKPWRHTGVTFLLSMTAHWACHTLFRATHTAIGVNPSAEGFYAAIHGFTRLGEPQPHAELTAPVIGLVQETGAGRDHYARHHREPMPHGRRIHEEFCTIGRTPACVEVPRELTGDGRWRLSRQVFREVFIHASDRLYSLDPDTQAYLMSQRSPETLRAPNIAQELAE